MQRLEAAGATSATVEATASSAGSGSDAELGIGPGGLRVTGAGSADVRLGASATGGTARVDVSAVSVDSTASSLVVLESATGSSGTAIVHVGGPLTITGADAQVLLHASGRGAIDVDGLTSAGSAAGGHLQILAADRGTIDLAGVSVSGAGWLDIHEAGDARVVLGNLSLSPGGGVIDVFVQQALAAAPMAPFIAHGAGTSDVSMGHLVIDGTGTVNFTASNLAPMALRSASLGAADVHMTLDDLTFATINKTTGLLDLRAQLVDRDRDFDDASITTTINGFTAASDSIILNGEAASAANFVDAGSFATQAEAETAIDAALDGTVKYVFAEFAGVGHVVYDGDGDDVTAVLALPGVTTLTADDLS
jgi:hypothetical protein